jgi:hypothetical protein
MLLLHSVMQLLVVLGVTPWHSKALPGRHIRLCLRQKRVTNILLAASGPAIETLVAQGPDGHVTLAAHELESSRRRLCRNAVNVHFQLFAEGLKWQIVYVVTEGVLDFATNGGKTEDNVGGEDATRNRNEAQRVVKLEWQNHDVDPSNLRDGDGVSNGERRVEDTIETNKTLVESDDTSNLIALVMGRT